MDALDCLYKIDSKFLLSYYLDEIITKDKPILNHSRIGIKDEKETKIIPLEMVLENIKKKFDNLSSITFSFEDIDRYKELLEALDKVDLDCDILVQFDENKYSLNDVAKVASSKTKIISPLISYKNITTVDKENRKNLDYISMDLNTINLNSSIMSNEEFLAYVDKVVEKINKSAKDDKEKVLLLDKYFKKNFKYDYKLIKENKKTSKNKESQSYYAQSLFKRKKGVCASFASLATVVLNHPELNIETNYVRGKNHAWNEIKIDDDWYSFDFSYNTAHKVLVSNFFIKMISVSMKEISLIKSDKVQKVGKWFLNNIYSSFLGDSFVKKPQSAEVREGKYNYETKEYENLGFDKYKTMPKEELLEVYKKIANVDVNINETSNKKR
ncbi:MAG: transglutaminase domain-containing protein [Bacilli bacterium]